VACQSRKLVCSTKRHNTFVRELACLPIAVDTSRVWVAIQPRLQAQHLRGIHSLCPAAPLGDKIAHVSGCYGEQAFARSPSVVGKNRGSRGQGRLGNSLFTAVGNPQ